MANSGSVAGIPWVMARFEYRNPTQRLRWAVEALPEHTKEAMLRGIARNRIIVGAYVDPRSGGICPMLAAHRNGGRTSLAAFARAWDAYTRAHRPRLARRREVATLVSFLEESLAEGTLGVAGSGSIAAAAAEIRSERAALAARDEVRREAKAELTPPEPEGAEPRVRRRLPTGEPHRGAELRDRLRWAWMRPTRRFDEFKDLVAAAEAELSEESVQDRDLQRSS
jgi:hypothetical protein